MKMIRWSGFSALAVIMLILVAVVLFAGGIIKSVLETNFTEMNGARVDISSVDISYSPFGFTLNDIQIADPQQAMINSAQIEQVKFELSFGNLLLGKLIVDQASIAGVQIDTPRKKSGLIDKTEEKNTSSEEAAADDSTLASDMQLPDIKTILEAEPLLTEKLINELDADYTATDKRWNEINASLPDKSKSDQYEQRYKQIQADAKGNTQQKLNAVKAAKQLSQEIKADAQAIKQAKEQFSTDLSRLSAELKAVKDAPAQDIARIKDKYSLGNMNAENISRMLFGDQVAEYTLMARQWYARIEPYISDDEAEVVEPEVERNQGVDVVFSEKSPMPDLYVAKASITASLPRGDFEGMISAISSDQSINKEPMRFKLQGVSMTNRESEKISAEFNYIDRKNGFTLFEYAMVKSQIDNFVVSKSNSLPLSMSKGLMDVDVDARLFKGAITGKANAKFSKVDFESADSSSMLASSFSGINEFYINSAFSGAIDELSVNIDSDLDSKIGQQFKKQIKAKTQEFDNELRAALDEKLKQPMAKVDAQKAKLDVIKNKVDSSQKQLDQRLASLQQTIDAATDEKKKAVTDNLKDKLKGKFGF